MSDSTVFDFDDETQNIGNINNTDVYSDAELYPNEDLETLDLDHPAFHDDNVNPEELELDFDQDADLNLLDDLAAKSGEYNGDDEQYTVATLKVMLGFWETMAQFDRVLMHFYRDKAELSDKVAECDKRTPELEKDLVELKELTLEVSTIALELDTDLLTLVIKVGPFDERVSKISDHMSTLNTRLRDFNKSLIDLIKQYNAL